MNTNRSFLVWSSVILPKKTTHFPLDQFPIPPKILDSKSDPLGKTKELNFHGSGRLIGAFHRFLTTFPISCKFTSVFRDFCRIFIYLLFLTDNNAPMIQFLLIVNKSGQTRFSKYYSFQSAKERQTLEGEVTRMCLGRREDEVCSPSPLSSPP